MDPPVTGLEFPGELGLLLLVFPLEVADREWDALLTAGRQTTALGGCRGAGGGGQ